MVKTSISAAALLFFSVNFLSGCQAVVTGEMFIKDKKPKDLRFAILSGGSEFFYPVKDGWETRCKDLGVSCIYQALDHEDSSFATGLDQCEYYIRKFIEIRVDGISTITCSRDDPNPDVFQEAFEAGIPVVTFDTDAPNSTRSAYVGTDNYFMGVAMARLLKQLRPDGGSFAVVSSSGENLYQRVAGFTKEITKDNNREGRAHWYELPMHPDYWGMAMMDRLESFVLRDPTALVTFYQTPMREANWTNLVESNRHRNITFIGTDGADYQLEYLTRRHVHGLIGQLPYDMGSETAQALYDLVTKGELEKEIIGTNLVAYNLIPLELPTLEVDQNLLGDLKYVGFACFGVVALLCLLSIAWTLRYRNDQVVRSAQPFFLMMVAAGVLIMASMMIPLSFDDMGDFESLSRSRSTGICMSVPWLGFTGFTITFSALSGKTWRVNKFFHSSAAFARIRVSERDVLAPFAILLTCNFIVLICWTVIDPLMYHREFELATDYWNREISSVGTCQSENLAAFLVPLGLINFAVVLIAAWQAFEARDIESEFSESKYIGFAVLSITQCLLTGIPIVAVVSEDPKTFYLVLTFMVFCLSVIILGLIFWPKYLIQKSYAHMSEPEQRKALALSIRKSAVKHANGCFAMSDLQDHGLASDNITGVSDICPVCGRVTGSSITSHVGKSGRSSLTGRSGAVRAPAVSDAQSETSDSGIALNQDRSVAAVHTVDAPAQMPSLSSSSKKTPSNPKDSSDSQDSKPTLSSIKESEVTIDA